MRRVAVVRSAQHGMAERALGVASDAVAAKAVALTTATARADAAFASWRVQADAACFLPEIERHRAAQVIVRTDEEAAARVDRDRATATLAGARQALARADAAVEQSRLLVRRLARRDRMRREERQLADQTDRVTQRWGKP